MYNTFTNNVNGGQDISSIIIYKCVFTGQWLRLITHNLSNIVKYKKMLVHMGFIYRWLIQNAKSNI